MIRPLADRVVIEPKAAETQTASGLYIPDTAKEKPQQGTVVAAGPGKKDEPMEVKVGDVVIYGKYSDEQNIVDGMAQAIRIAIAALVFKAEISTSDPGIVADNTNHAIVLTAEYIETYAECIEASGDYAVSFEPNSYGVYSTGATVIMSKDGCDDIIYTVAVLGDIDGNGKVNNRDLGLLQQYLADMDVELHYGTVEIP